MSHFCPQKSAQQNPCINVLHSYLYVGILRTLKADRTVRVTYTIQGVSKEYGHTRS